MNNNISLTGNQSGIYQVRNTVNNKVYVGQSSRMGLRRSQHRRELLDGCHYNKYLQRSFLKYGEENFVFEVLEYCPPEALNERERYWIEKTESEYADKGYNAAYAYTLFNHYDQNRKINVSKRKPTRTECTDETRKKISESNKRHFEIEENRIKQSLYKSRIDLDTVVMIKKRLHDDLDITPAEIAEALNVSGVSVTHIRNLASHELIASEYNHVIKNRAIIADKRKDRIAIDMYRSGEPYSEIAKAIGCHLRTAIRRTDKIKNEHDDRCRLNSINRAAKKKASLINTLHNMGFSVSRTSATLGFGRRDVANILKHGAQTFDELGSTRGKARLFNYKRTNQGA